ncbi:hypothetical protein STEG23_007219 [Scotinomys teguina]
MEGSGSATSRLLPGCHRNVATVLVTPKSCMIIDSLSCFVEPLPGLLNVEDAVVKEADNIHAFHSRHPDNGK